MARQKKNIVPVLPGKNILEDSQVVGVREILVELKKTREDPDPQNETEKKHRLLVPAEGPEKGRNHSVHDLLGKRSLMRSEKSGIERWILVKATSKNSLKFDKKQTGLSKNSVA